MDITQILGYIGALLIGVILGLMGGGGSILTVPLLVYFLGLDAVMATGYSLFVIGSSALFGVIQKHRKGLVDFKIGLAFSFPSFVAVYSCRRYIVPNMPSDILKIGEFILTKDMAIMVFFALVMFMAAFSMIKKRKELQTKTPQPYYKTFIQGVIIGLVTGLIGAGGGFLYVPALVIWAGLPMKKAVGTSLVIVAINSLIGFLGDVQTISVDWPFILTFSAFTILGILLGGYLSKFISNKKLKKSFGYLILLMAVYILYKEIL